MTYEEILLLPVDEIHLCLISEVEIIKMYKDGDRPANTELCMKILDLLIHDDTVAEKMGPIVLDKKTGIVMDGCTLLRALHAYLLARGAYCIRTQFMVI